MSAEPACGPRSTNDRRTKAEIARLSGSIYELCEEHHPLSLRNLFYLMVTAAIIAKTEAEYRNVVLRLSGLMRERGELPWGWIVDNSRIMRKPDTYTGLHHLLDETVEFYRRDLWHELGEYVEVWCESDSIGGVLVEETWDYDVPLFAQRGFGSKTFIRSAAENIAAKEKPTTVYYVGDFDPSGVVASRRIERDLTRYLGELEFDESFRFVPLAVLEGQIEDLDLPTKPPKTKGNTHAKNTGWDRALGTVESEAIPPETMRALLRDAIESHIPAGHLERLKQIEEQERVTLSRMAFDLEMAL